MNTLRKRILIYLSLTLIFTMACEGCYIFPGTARTVGEIKCVSEGYNMFEGRTEYQCFCPIDPSYSNTLYTITARDFTDPEGLKSKACFSYYAAQAQQNSLDNFNNNPAPTDAPTDAPTEAPTEPPLASILDGRVSYCSVTADQYYMNLPFNSGADPAAVQQELDNGNLKVEIDGTNTQGRCKVLASNNMLLCAFPASSFPAFGAANTILNVVDKGTVIDVIPFNSACTVPQPANSGGSGGEGGGGGSVPACDPHTDPACPVDCSNPANADLCG